MEFQADVARLIEKRSVNEQLPSVSYVTDVGVVDADRIRRKCGREQQA